MLVPLLLGLVVALVLGSSVHNGFVYDDAVAIAGNSRVHGPTSIGTIFTSPYWTNTLYRPVTTTAFAGLWWLGSGSPMPFHLANLVLLLGVCLLLHHILVRLGASPIAALIAALLFSVHPVHVEVVANGVGLAELLSTGCLLAGAVIGLRRPWTTRTGMLLGVCGLLGFLSKESGITGLALIPLIWFARPRSEGDPPAAARLEAAFLLALFLGLGLAVRTIVLGGLSGEAPIRALHVLDTFARLQTVLGVVPEWARLLVWPASLQADYSPPQIPIGGPFGWRHSMGLVILLGWLISVAIAARKRFRLIAAGLLWIPIALSPVSNVLFATGIVLAERTLFLPSVGLALIVAGLVDAMPRWRAPIVGVAAVLIVLGGVRSHSRVGVWRDQETFFRQLVVDGDRSSRGWYSAGGYASRTGDAPRALHHYGEAWKLEKGDFRIAEEYGQSLRAVGRYDEAIAVLRQGFATEPNHEPLTSRLLESLMSAGRMCEARELIAKVATLSTDDAERLQRRFNVVRHREQQPTR